MLRTKHLKMAVVPMTLLALLSTAVPVASAQETTDESFYELTTTPSGGDMIVGEPGTTILFDSSNGELVDVLPPSEAEDYSVTVSRGCADSNAGCWAGGNALVDVLPVLKHRDSNTCCYRVEVSHVMAEASFPR